MADFDPIMTHFFGTGQSDRTEKEQAELKDLASLEPYENADELVMVIDRSGSMGGILDDAQGGINAFIEEQKKADGKANLTLAEFDNNYEVVYQRTPLDKVPGYELRPRGMTALLDAIGRTMATYRDVKTTGKKIAVVVTDGHENCSQEWDRPRILELIESLKSEGWEFVFLAASEQAIDDAASFGFDRDASIQFDANMVGTSQATYAATAAYTTSLRGGKSKAAAIADMDQIVHSTAGLSKTGK